MELENNFGKGVEKFESGVAKARDKIDSIGEQTKEQYQNWKRVLSGALNDKQLIIALAVMFGFYLFFSGFNTILGGNAREENTMTCACPVGHSAYYRTVVVVAVVAWVVCFVLTTIWDTVKFWRYAIGKRSSLHHQTSLASIDIESAKDRAPSMLEQTIGSVEKGVQAASKIPVKSIFTKAMGIVKDTLDMVDEGAKTLHKIDSGLKEVKENPLESVLNKSMEVVDNVITHRLESSDENAPKVSDSKQNPTVTETMTPLNHGSLTHGGSLLSTATGMVGSRTEQIPENATITKPIGFAEDDDSKMLTKSAARSRLATNVLSSQCPTESPTTTQTNGGSVLTKVTKAKKSHSKKSLQCTRQLTEADTNALQRLKHYENYLWLQFYKVYSVGATLQDKDQVLPTFIHVLGSDHEEPADGYEASADDHDEFKPIIEEKKPHYPETELVEVESSYNDVDGDEIPAIVIESDENHDTEEDHNTDEVPIVIIESNMSGKISDTMSDCDDTENNDSTAAENDEQTTYSHEINLRATDQDDKDLTSDPIPAMDHPLKLTQSNSSMLSVKSNSTQPNSSLAQSTATLSSGKSNSADEEDDFLASWVSLKPVGLYNEPVDEENVVMVVADATCARVSFFLYPVLVLSRLLSQLVLVPLLLFQILDTYAWICISGDIYCSSILNQYRLGLDKAALAFTFYCCLLASILATAILRWFPCSKYARKAGATCIM